jgi:hypothetical protein
VLVSEISQEEELWLVAAWRILRGAWQSLNLQCGRLIDKVVVE